MKKSRNRFLLLLIIICFIAFAQVSLAQAPPPPPSQKGSSTNKAPGGGAPIDGGLGISLALIAGFSVWKGFKGMKNKQSSL
jgi:hypothetical protein